MENLEYNFACYCMHGLTKLNLEFTFDMWFSLRKISSTSGNIGRVGLCFNIKNRAPFDLDIFFLYI